MDDIPTDYLPVSGGNIEGTLTYQGYEVLNSHNVLDFFETAQFDNIGVQVTGNINLTGTGNATVTSGATHTVTAIETNLNTSTGKANYNGVEIATKDDILDTSKVVKYNGVNQNDIGYHVIFSNGIEVSDIRPFFGVLANVGSHNNRFEEIYCQSIGTSTTPTDNGYFTNLKKGGKDVSTVDHITALQTQIDELKAEIEVLKTNS